MTTTFKFLGVSAFEIANGEGIKILVDPFITGNPLCPVTLDEMTDIDMILVTHGASDHMGDAITIAKRQETLLVCGKDVGIHASKNGVGKEKITPVLWGDHIEHLGVKIQTVECRHMSLLESNGICLTGIPLSFIISPENGTRIYNVGDTSIFSDMKLIAELYDPNILLIPVGGEPETTGGYAHLSPREAALATQWVLPELSIPVHYGLGSREPADYEDYTRLLAPTVKVHQMKPGETAIYDPETHKLTHIG